MHEWHTEQSRNPMSLIGEFAGYEHAVDDGYDTVEGVKITNRIFASHEEAIDFVTRQSYGGDYAYLAAYTTKKLSKAYQNAFSNFLAKDKEYMDFSNHLTIAYGRKASKVTCPECGSSINLKYGNRFKRCPVCGSSKIISDSNWKTLETKRKMREKAAEGLAKEAEKNDVWFVCGFEWHC